MKTFLILVGFFTSISTVSGVQREPLNQWNDFAGSRLMFNGGCQSLPSSIEGVREDWRKQYEEAVPKEMAKAVESYPAYTKMREKLRKIQKQLGFEDDSYRNHPKRISLQWRFEQSGGNSHFTQIDVQQQSNYGGYNGAEKGAAVPLFYYNKKTGNKERVDATLPYDLVHEYFVLEFDQKYFNSVFMRPHFSAMQSVLTEKQFDSLIAIGVKYNGVNAFLDTWIIFALELDGVQQSALRYIYDSGRTEIRNWLAEWDAELKKYNASNDKLEDYRRLITLERKIRKSQFSLEADLLEVLTESQLKKYKKWMKHRIHREEVDVMVNGQKLFVKRSEPLVKLPKPPK